MTLTLCVPSSLYCYMHLSYQARRCQDLQQSRRLPRQDYPQRGPSHLVAWLHAHLVAIRPHHHPPAHHLRAAPCRHGHEGLVRIAALHAVPSVRTRGKKENTTLTLPNQFLLFVKLEERKTENKSRTQSVSINIVIECRDHCRSIIKGSRFYKSTDFCYHIMGTISYHYRLAYKI